MWDAIGRISGRPVADLLGRARDRLRIYRTTVFAGKQDQSDVPYATQAAFATEQDRLMSELLSAQQASRVKDRPETADDVPELTVFDTGAVRPTGLDEQPDVKPTITPIAPPKKE